MADEPRLAVALLAAGSSRRFGAADKLTADFRGAVLGHHAARALSAVSADIAWVIASSASHACAEGWRNYGFEIAVNLHAENGMSTSVAMAAGLAQEAGADALLIALADMPLVPTSHFRQLADYALQAGENAIFVSAFGEQRLPPASFGKGRFDVLAASKGDQGARQLLVDGSIVTCPAGWLADIDDAATLARLS